MALHILKSGPTTGEKFGQSLATGLSALAEGKLAQVQQRNQQSAFEQVLKQANPNLKPEEVSKLSRSLSVMSPEDRREFSKGLSQQITGNQFSKNFAQDLGIEVPGIENRDTQEAAQAVGIPSQQTQAPTRERSEFEVPTPPVMKPIPGEEIKGAIKIKEISPKDNLVSTAKKLIQEGYPLPKNEKEKSELFKEAHKSLIEDRKLALKERQFDREDQREIDKETLPFYQESTKSGKVAAHNDRTLNRVEELVKRGNLGSPILNSSLDTLAKGFGYLGVSLDLNHLKTADAQELEKLSTEFIKGAKDIFGSRLTDLDLRTYLKGIPNLMQTREGMLRVIANMRISNDIEKLRSKTMEQIIQENGGKRPRNLEFLVEEKISPLIDTAADKFRSNIGENELAQPTIAGSKDLGSIAQSLNLIY